MKTIIRGLITALLLISFTQADAQVKKLKEAIEDGNYKRLVSLSEKYMNHKEYRKDPSVYYYHAQGLYELSKDAYWFEKNPDAIKQAVKAVYKGLKRDDDSSVIRKFSTFIDELCIKQNELAEKQYNINKHSKALKMYTLSFGLNENRPAYVMMGKTALLSYDTALAEQCYSVLIGWYNDDLESGYEEQEQVTDPHIYFINKYWLAKNYDSANYFLEDARRIFGNEDAKLSFYQKEIGMEQINSMPPSPLMMDYIKKNLALFPTDTNFLHKENALYIYLLKNHIKEGRYVATDTMLLEFTREKVARSRSVDAQDIKLGDEFVMKEPSHVLWKLAEYFQSYSHNQSAQYVLGKYIGATAADTTPEAIAERWLTISDYAFKTKEVPFASFVLQQSIKNTEKDPKLLALRQNTIETQLKNPLNVESAAAIYELANDEYADDPSYPKMEQVEVIGEKYINLLIKNVRFSTVRAVMSELTALNPKKDYDLTHRMIAQEDFYQNYFLTKTKGADADGNIVELFKWEGSISRCDPGMVDPSIQQKVLDRINYFRRNAGVPDVLFDAATNEYCQQAALMMTANRQLDHNPPKTWRCFTEDGANAAKYSLITKGTHTALAVTHVMADQNNPMVGNRRWLLHPGGRIYGHGSTNENAVIWALDDSGTADSTHYTENAVCWPPQGYVPQLMLFKHWSFAIYQDLKNAKVTVTLDGKDLPVKIEKLEDGYSLPTLVFTPTYAPTDLQTNSNFEVSITLSDGSNYSYTVKSFDYDPNKL